MQFDEASVFERYPFREAAPLLIDVGANDGTWAARFADTGWEVVAYEPDPETYARLCSTMESRPRVTCVRKAVSDQRATLPLYRSARHPGIHTLAPFDPSHEESGYVEVVRLADDLRSRGIERVTALKIDAEGADLPVLRGFPFDAMRPELVMAEFMDSRTSDAWGYTHHDVVEYMRRCGYASIVSEWAPIIEYAGVGDAHPHDWLGVGPYSAKEISGWGNLLFTPRTENRTLRKPSQLRAGCNSDAPLGRGCRG